MSHEPLVEFDEILIPPSGIADIWVRVDGGQRFRIGTIRRLHRGGHSFEPADALGDPNQPHWTISRFRLDGPESALLDRLARHIQGAAIGYRRASARTG